jgi:uncharacterized protein (DUF1499 family)
MQDVNTARKPRTLARGALVAALAGLLTLGGSGPLYQLEVLPLGVAYAGVGIAIALAVGAIGTAARLIARHRAAHTRMQQLAAAVALALAAFTIVVPARAYLRARTAPPLHDITTDLHQPPLFTVLDDVEAPAKLTRSAGDDALQRERYPDIAPLVLPVSTDMAFEEVLETMAELDWPVADGSEDEGRVEATVRSPWFGFRDDIVVRLTAVADQTRVDVRAVSRDGRNDGGRNAAHVREFLTELRR